MGVAAVALVHCMIWFSIYNQTALGESPALDNRQTLELAKAMAEGALTPDPFHRAPLYPYLLSLFLSVGLPYELLPIVARWLNALALAATAGASSVCAIALWKRPTAGWIAGLLVALNPVLIFFAGDAFDILLATTPLLLALALLPRWLEAPSLRRSLEIAVLLSIGSALRSHILPIAIIWPIASLFLAKRHRMAHAATALAPLFASFLLLGCANLRVAGEFRMMPWQGSYNLWAGNGPDANGRIYAQKIRVQFGGSYDNPAKLESIALYEAETGNPPPHSIDAMNAYWKTKAIDHITENPVEWLGLMARKAYFFLNSYEQYDNKTYGFHKQRHPILKWNPIHWGALLLLAVVGALIAYRDEKMRPYAIALTILFAAYAAGTILFYTSNRFRVPMIPVLTILAAGAAFLPQVWNSANRPWRRLLIACCSITLALAYSEFFGARDTNTWEEDHALLANASLRTARDIDAIHHAKSALEMNPARPDMHAVLAQASFNRWAFDEGTKSLTTAAALATLESLRIGSAQEPHLLAVLGLYQWKLQQTDKAVATWNSIADHDALARLCLFWTGFTTVPSQEEMIAYREHPSYPLMAAVLQTTQDPKNRTDETRFLDALLSPVASPLEQ